MVKLSKVQREEAERVLSAAGDLNLGTGLWLRPPRGGRAGALQLVLRYSAPDGRRRELGLGTVERVSVQQIAHRLETVRSEVAEARRLLREGKDPIEVRNAERERARHALQGSRAAAKAEALTLARAARDYHARVIEPARTYRHARQWIASLEQNVPPAIWHKPIGTVTGPELLDALAELQARVPETALRVRQRLDAVFEDSVFRGLAQGNPAAGIKRKLREMKGRRVRGKFSALPFSEAPAFMCNLRAREGIAARALEFAILTAARTGEVIGATWPEFDLAAGVWIVAADRMKGREAHTVYLPPRAVQIIEGMRELGQPYVFPRPALDGGPLSAMAMLALLRRMDADKRTTVHGVCRASFSTWANETGAARPDVIEACLAHSETNRIRASYNRAQFAQERRLLLAAWAEYLGCKPA